jgi:indole-3-glycerol phosphate synthase
MIFIAEIKPKSPFGFKSPYSREYLFEIAAQDGDWIAAHTHLDFDGSFDWLTYVRKNTNKTLVAKGYHYTNNEVKHAFDCGADFVLIVGRYPNKLGSKVPLHRCLLKPNTLEQLAEFEAAAVPYAVWNSRDLATGTNKAIGFDTARSQFSRWLCQASNIKTPADVNPKADAILVGSYLPEYVKFLKKAP